MSISKNSVIYQIVTDRFDNEKGDLYRKAYEPDYNFKFKTYLGGTFKGIRKHIGYLKELGVTHLLMSPFQKSKSYHGYDILDFFKVNPNFGSEDDLKSLIKELHSKGISVIMDYVATHVSSESDLFKNKTSLDFFLFKDQSSRSKNYRGYYNNLVYKITSGNPSILNQVNPSPYLSFFGLESYPFFNLMNPEVVKFHKGVLDYWVDNFGIDDVRLDSSFLQPLEFVREITNYLKSKNKNIDTFVEHWDFKVDFGKSRGFSSGEFHIPLGLSLNSLSSNPLAFNEIVQEFFYSKEIIENYGAISYMDNHDLPRFKGGKKLQKISAALQFSLPFTPLIYYGDEIGMEEFNDGSDRLARSRDVMRFDHHDSSLFEFYKNFVKFREGFDFERFEMSDLQINDNGTLLSFRLEDGKTKPYYAIFNRERRDKPVVPSDLFSGSKTDNFDFFSKSYCPLLEDGRILIRSESANLFKEK